MVNMVCFVIVAFPKCNAPVLFICEESTEEIYDLTKSENEDCPNLDCGFSFSLDGKFWWSKE